MTKQGVFALDAGVFSCNAAINAAISANFLPLPLRSREGTSFNLISGSRAVNEDEQQETRMPK
jgi:hypothetical protein